MTESQRALAAIHVAGPVAPWRQLGFSVTDDASGAAVIALANGALSFAPLSGAPAATGLTGLSVTGPTSETIEGIPVLAGHVHLPGGHANGAIELDHVVVMTNSLERTSTAVTEILGLECRRIREAGTVRQAFHRFADADGYRGCILELVEREDSAHTALWGVVVNVVDVQALQAFEHVSSPKPAVQPGRWIASVNAAAGHGVPVAFMSR